MTGDGIALETSSKDLWQLSGRRVRLRDGLALPWVRRLRRSGKPLVAIVKAPTCLSGIGTTTENW